ncbi:MAG: CbtB domain-containing protein [Rhodospirillales bacterium]|tara:strand:+ start:356 stop:532 length:177 start_codon:yes stop_codon:yes gene_type:complete
MTTQTHSTAVTTVAERAMPAALALLFGVFLLFGTGFAHPEAVHNAAHDTRHAFSFPCH